MWTQTFFFQCFRCYYGVLNFLLWIGGFMPLIVIMNLYVCKIILEIPESYQCVCALLLPPVFFIFMASVQPHMGLSMHRPALEMNLRLTGTFQELRVLSSLPGTIQTSAWQRWGDHSSLSLLFVSALEQSVRFSSEVLSIVIWRSWHCSRSVRDRSTKIGHHRHTLSLLS